MTSTAADGLDITLCTCLWEEQVLQPLTDKVRIYIACIAAYIGAASGMWNMLFVYMCVGCKGCIPTIKHVYTKIILLYMHTAKQSATPL